MSDPTLFRFLLVGAANTAIGYAVVMWAHYVLGASPLVANTCGYLVGGLVSYLLNRCFTFGSRRGHATALPLFAACVGACFALNTLVLMLSMQVLQLPFPVAQAGAMLVYSAALYVMSRFVVFPR